jgi:myxalamid-type nonribosomal peptide synthetase MxaA
MADCLVRAESAEAGYRKIEGHMKSLRLWDQAKGHRIVPVLGDLASPLLGLNYNKFEELAGTIDVIYHSGATVNFYYPYPLLKAANVLKRCCVWQASEEASHSTLFPHYCL